MQILCIVISDTPVGPFLDMLFLLLAVILSELYEKPRIERKTELKKKVHRIICVRDITFLTAPSSFLCIFAVFFVYSPPPPSQVTHLRNGYYKDTYIAMSVVLV